MHHTGTGKLVKPLSGQGCLEILIASSHTTTAGELPVLHKDPFDRLLIAQAMVENLFLLTCDRKIAEYSASVLYILK
jgi:PIN domain nuclease of toxin-antitoxin system